MNTPSFRDVEQLSAYLDGKLSPAERARLESRLRADPALASVLEELRQTRAVLRSMPQRRAPRSFTLTPKTAGLRPPVSRAVPTLSWASAVAMLLFVCTLGTNLLGRFSFGAAAPMMSAAPGGMGGGSDSAAQEVGIGGGPAATEAPVAAEAPTPEAAATAGLSLLAPEPTPAPTERNAADQLPSTKIPREPIDPWLFVWPGLAAVLIGAALLIRWASVLRFRKRVGPHK